jgi:hypothetical protein
VGGGDEAGGSRELARLIDEYGEFLIPDLKHYYDLDLRDLFSDDNPLCPKFVLAFVRNLPIESAFIAEVRGGRQFRGWDEDRYQSAALINALRVHNYYFALANCDPKKRRNIKPPDMWPLPDEVKKRDAPGSFAFIAKAHLAAAKKRKALADASR